MQLSKHLSVIGGTLFFLLLFSGQAVKSLTPKILIQAQTSVEASVEAEQLYKQGNKYYKNSQFSQALTNYQKVLVIYRQIGFGENIAKTLYAIGVTYNHLANYNQAHHSLQQALVIYREINNKKMVGKILNALGAITQSQGKYPQAIKFYQQALAISKTVGDNEAIAHILNNLGKVYQSTSKYPQALKFYRQSLALRQKIDDKSGIGDSLNSIGTIYYENRKYPQALKFYQQALKIAQTTKSLKEQGNINNNLGLIHHILGQYELALKDYQQALTIFIKIGDKAGEGNTLHNIGSAYYQKRNYPQAISFYEQALTIRQEIGQQANIGKTLNNIGFVYQEMGLYTQALESLEKAVEILQQVGNRAAVGHVLDSIGTVYKNLKKYSQALEAYQQALAIRKELGDRRGKRFTFSNIGDVLAQQNQPELAIIFYKQSVNITEAIRQELRSLPPEQQKSYTITIANTYRRLADLLLQQDRVLEAQHVLDLLKIQEIDDYLRNVQGNEKTAQGIDSRPQEQKIIERLNTVTNQQIQISRQLATLQKIPHQQRTPQQKAKISELKTEILKKFNKFRNTPEVKNWLEQLSRRALIQDVPLEFLNSLRSNLQRLNQEAVLLYPLILENRLELVLTTPDQPPIHHSVPVKRKELNRAILEFRESLTKPKSNAKVPAQKLYKWLIKPIETELAQANAKTIVYAPDAQLRYIPLSALYDGKKWLAQRFRINYITAISLKDLNNKPLPQIQILAGATTQRHIVEIDSSTLPPFKALQYAGVEVENIAKMIPKTKKLLDSEFNRQSTIPYLNKYTIVHMATHAKFVNGEPKESFILLGDGKLITLPEIENLSLPNVDLVVLSACETAVGDELGKGEEILGFGFQIQNTGAKAAIASLWSVNDGGTQALMNAFYAILNQGNMTKAEALRQAQVAMITGNFQGIGSQHNREILQSTRNNLPPQVSNNLSHPFYWAPFILIGNGL